MRFGGPVRSVEDISFLQKLGFDFGELTLSSAASRRRWWESGIRNNQGGFSLIAHGPTVADDPGDLRYLWGHYLPELMATVDAVRRMGITLLTIHLLVDSRTLNGFTLAEKKRALRELVAYGMKSHVLVCLENLTESAKDLEAVFAEVPDLSLTLDVGHAQLCNPSGNGMRILRQLRRSLRHVHLHDNHGGTSQADDLHLAIGDGSIDFRELLEELVRSGYGAGLTLEVKRESLELSLRRVQALLDEISRKTTFR